MSEFDFSEQAVLAAASAQAGSSALGDADLAGLRALLETYDTAGFNAQGRKRYHRRIVGAVATRMRLEAAFAAHPEIAERPIERPMVLTGLPRSGTSAQFNLLAADPAARPLLLWETQFPDPPAGAERGAPDPRYDAVRQYYERMAEKAPDWNKIHFTSADTPEECVLIHAYAFHGVQLGVEIFLEPYASWYSENVDDLAGMYALERRILQALDWQRPGERWLLKAPAHMWGIDALIDEFPDVAIVWSHRHPVAGIASACSMTAELMSKDIEMDPQRLGPMVFDFYASSLERGLAARDRSDPARFVDVHHDAFVADGLATARQIYAHFELPFGDDVEQALAAYVAAHPKGKHGSHDYELEAFGLSEDAILERMAPYMERFGIASEE